MKRLLILPLILLASLSLRAASYTYFAQLRATASPQAGGTVYADTLLTDSAAYAAVSTAPQQVADKKGTEKVFYAYARPAEGYGFRGWADAQLGEVFSRRSPVALSVEVASENNKTRLRTVYALFSRLSEVEVGFLLPTRVSGQLGGGTYTASFGGQSLPVSSYTEATVSSPLTLTAAPAEGYKFFGWYMVDDDQNRTFFSYDNPLTDYPLTSDCELAPAFVEEDTPVFQVEGRVARYAGLADALAHCPDSATLVLVSDGTLHGAHTVPAGVCLLVPFDDDHHCYRDMPLTRTQTEPQQEYARLTLASDASLTVAGELSVSARMRSGNGSALTGCGNTDGFYGRLHLDEGASLTLLQGARLYAWGFVTGLGGITAESGSAVYEGFHFPVFRGGSAMSELGGNRKRVFPVNQYYIQHIEAPLTLRYGAAESVVTTAFADDKINDAQAVFIGAGGLFQPAEGTSVCKRYDPLTDRVLFDIWGDTRLDKFDLSIAGYIINSESYALPITNNMTIRIHSGNTLIVNDLALLPGARIMVDAGAVVTIGPDSRTFVYDADEWLLGDFAFPGKLQPAVYSPTRVYDRTLSDLTDARLDVNGTLRLEGQLFTTAGGADVCSSLASGRIEIVGGVQDTVSTYQAEQSGAAITYVQLPCDAARLRNASSYAGEAYTPTAGLSAAVIIYANGHWLLPGAVAPGDVNADGSVDVSDISTLAEYIFGGDPSSFDAGAADANGDGDIDVSDISTIAEIIFGM